MSITAVWIGYLLFTFCHQVASSAKSGDDYFSLLSDFQVSGEEVVVVHARFSRLGPRSVESARLHQVKFEAFNRTYDLGLRPSIGLVSPHFSVIIRDGNASQITPIKTPLTPCFYRGSDAAFDLCHGIRGIVTLSSNEFLSIEPLRRTKRSTGESRSPHLVKKMSWNPKWLQVSNGKKRHRRNVDRGSWPVTIETAVFVDAYLYNHMKRTSFPDDTEREMTHFVLAMINAVQLLYQDESLNRQIEFQVQRLEMWTRQPADLVPILSSSGSPLTTSNNKASIHDIDRYLNRFCHWQSRENPNGDQDLDHWDHALLLTGLDLFAVGRDGFTTHQIVGLAPIGGMCTATSSCTVNEGRHFESVYVVAHEIGHNLGMKHDGREAGNDCDAGSFLMSPTLGSGKTQWSPCSKHYLDSFLSSVQAGCLRDRSWSPGRLNHNSSSTLPGERFTADEQCVLRYGKDSRALPQRTLNEICRDLRCSNVPTRTIRQVSSGLLSHTSHPALEGTACGDGMWCRRGRCTSRIRLQNYESDSNGYNSGEQPSWSIIAPCASGCLYGYSSLSSGSMAISTSVQNCQYNLPCSNVSLRFQTCDGSKLCSNVTRTTIQQYTDEVCYQAAQQNSTILPKGIQQLSVDAYRSCQVWCYLRTGELMTASGWLYPDGTRCQSVASTIQYGVKTVQLCLSGKCQDFSCDSHSTHQLHPSVCRSEEPAESNTIYDYSYPAQKVMSVKYNEKPYYPVRPGYPQNFKYVAPMPLYTQTPPTIAQITMSSEDYLSPIVKSVSGWSEWKVISSCRSGCLTSSKGLRLVQRTCDTGTCEGPSRSVQLCIPNDQECPQSQPITAFADRVCREQHWSGLHRGVQMWMSTERSENSCIVYCRDPRSNELTPASGENGWFPSGTLCDLRKPAYCLSGRCVEFNEKGIPI